MPAPAIGTELSPALIVEDSGAMQHRLRRLLQDLLGADAEIAVVDSIARAKAHLGEDAQGLALIDIGLPDGSGIDLIAWLHTHHPRLTTVVISAFGADGDVLAALRAGASGYLLKDREDIELSLALQSIRRGGAPIDPNIARRILDLFQLSAEPTTAPAVPAKPHELAEHALSERESEILRLVARGHSNREIAELTSLSRFTVEDHTKSIYRKLAVRSRTAAVYTAKARGLLR
ncbi:MAG TPA: response regulator transcription factor [Rhodanobacter sp.]